MTIFNLKSNNNDETEESWICKECTLENPGPATLCLACSSRPKMGKVKKPKPADTGFWVCNFCTLKNESGVVKCTACESPKSEMTSPAVAITGNSHLSSLKCAGKESRN